MHPGGMRSAMDLFDFEKSANLKHPNVHTNTSKEKIFASLMCLYVDREEW